MAKLDDSELDDILSKQKPGFRRVKRSTPKQKPVPPESGTPDLNTLERKAAEIAAGEGSRSSSSSGADDTSQLLKRFLGEEAAADAAAQQNGGTAGNPAGAGIDIVQVRPTDSDDQEGPIRPSVVISRSKKKIIAESG